MKPVTIESSEVAVAETPFRKLRGNRPRRQIAIAMDVTEQTIANWERLVYIPDLLMVDQLASVYEVPAKRIEQAILECAKLIRSIRQQEPTAA